MIRHRNQFSDDPYYAAHREHAFLLRCEGLKYREIAARMGVRIGRARQLTHSGAADLRRAMARGTVHKGRFVKTRVYFT